MPARAIPARRRASRRPAPPGSRRTRPRCSARPKPVPSHRARASSGRGCRARAACCRRARGRGPVTCRSGPSPGRRAPTPRRRRRRRRSIASTNAPSIAADVGEGPVAVADDVGVAEMEVGREPARHVPPRPSSTSHAGSRVARPSAVTAPWTVTAVADRRRRRSSAGTTSGTSCGPPTPARRGRRRRRRSAARGGTARTPRARWHRPVGSPLGVRVPEVAEVLDAGLLEVRDVAAVVDDLHRVGLGEAHAEPVGNG